MPSRNSAALLLILILIPACKQTQSSSTTSPTPNPSATMTVQVLVRVSEPSSQRRTTRPDAVLFLSFLLSARGSTEREWQSRVRVRVHEHGSHDVGGDTSVPRRLQRWQRLGQLDRRHALLRRWSSHRRVRRSGSACESGRWICIGETVRRQRGVSDRYWREGMRTTLQKRAGTARLARQGAKVVPRPSGRDGPPSPLRGSAATFARQGAKVGGRREDRTRDLCIANAALSQLS